MILSWSCTPDLSPDIPGPTSCSCFPNRTSTFLARPFCAGIATARTTMILSFQIAHFWLLLFAVRARLHVLVVWFPARNWKAAVPFCCWRLWALPFWGWLRLTPAFLWLLLPWPAIFPLSKKLLRWHIGRFVPALSSNLLFAVRYPSYSATFNSGISTPHAFSCLSQVWAGLFPIFADWALLPIETMLLLCSPYLLIIAIPVSWRLWKLLQSRPWWLNYSWSSHWLPISSLLGNCRPLPIWDSLESLYF